MAGSHHSARQPTRLSSIGRRSARSIGDRRRVSEADLRRGIYVRPLGLGYHVVKNVCNDQEYVVADATNLTFKPGVVVSLGSFTGNPGEFVLGKPPAGFGGASSFAIQRANAGYGITTDPTPNTLPVPFSPAEEDFIFPVLASSPPASRAYVAIEADPRDGMCCIGICYYSFSQLPVDMANPGGNQLSASQASVLSGQSVGTVVTGFAQTEFFSTPTVSFLGAARIGGTDSIMVAAHDGSSAEIYIINSSSRTTVGPQATAYNSSNFSMAMSLFNAVAIGSYIYSVEPATNGTHIQKIFKRDTSLSEIASAEFDSTFVTFDGFSTSGAARIVGIAREGTGVRVFMYPYPVSGANDRIYYRDLNSDLSWLGSWTKIPNLGLASGFPPQILSNDDFLCQSYSGGSIYHLGLKLPGGSGDWDWFSLSDATDTLVASDVFASTDTPFRVVSDSSGGFYVMVFLLASSQRCISSITSSGTVANP